MLAAFPAPRTDPASTAKHVDAAVVLGEQILWRLVDGDAGVHAAAVVDMDAMPIDPVAVLESLTDPSLTPDQQLAVLASALYAHLRAAA